MPLLSRGATTTPVLSVFLVVVVAALSYLGAAAPAFIENGRTATIQRAVEALPDLAQWPSATTPGLPAFSEVSEDDIGVWGGARTTLEELRREQPEPLRTLLGEPRIVMAVDSSSTADDDPARTTPVPDNRVGLVSDPGLDERAELVDGRLPELTDPSQGIEIVLTDVVAEQLGWAVGTQRRWEDTTLVLTGIVTPSGRDDGDWSFISGSAEPQVEVTASGDRILVGAGFMHVDEAAALTDRVSDIKISAWMPFDASRLDADTAGAAAAQLRLLSATPADIELYDRTFYNRGLPFSSSLPQTIETGIVRGDAMTTVVTVAAVGPIAVALVVLVLVSRRLR